MKMSFNPLNIIQGIVAAATLVLVLFIKNFDDESSLNILFILMALNLVLMGSREFKQNKKSACFLFIVALFVILLLF